MKNMRARKRHLVGLETEMLLLDEDGSVSTCADEVIQIANAAKLKFPLHHDYTYNMIEIASIANVKVIKGVHGWLQTMKHLLGITNKLGVKIYPFGTYHGTHVPTPRTDRYYRMCEDILGPKKYVFCTGHVTGFHLHYTLPYGTFNYLTRNLKQMFRSKYKEQLLNVYNAIIAIDPAVTNYMESSPFVDGVHIAKDSRLLLYRSIRHGKGSDAVKGLYYDLPMFGKLPRYSQTISDLILLVEERYSLWRELVEDKHPEYLDIVEHRHPLQFNWGPLRINRVGTFEYRGCDMNLPSNLIGTSLLVKYFLHRIRQDELTVKSSDIGIKEPFKIEGNEIFVPPYAYLNDVLQYKSTLYGLEDDDVYRYTKAFTSLAINEVPLQKDPALNKIIRMLENRKTKSDEILDLVIKTGHSLSEKLDENFARELALKGCEELEREVDRLLDAELAIDLEE